MDIAVIGAPGSVGRAVCMQLLSTGVVGPGERLQLVGRRGGSSELGIYGLRIDLLDAYASRGPWIETVLDGDQIDADIIVMVAGSTPSTDAANPTDREAVAHANLPTFEHYAQVLAEHGAKDELVIVQSNPVELAVDVFSDALGRHRVVGAGSYNDTLRFRREVAADFDNAGSAPVVTGYMLGEHGAHAVPIWSSVRAGGTPPGTWDAHLDRIRPPHPLADLPALCAEARATLSEFIVAHRAVEASAFVSSLSPDIRSLVKPWFAHWTGRTSTATAHSAVDLVDSLQGGHRVVLPLQVQVHADEWPGVETVLGVPVTVDATGWHEIVPLPLTDEERAALLAAGDAISSQLAHWRGLDSRAAGTR